MEFDISTKKLLIINKLFDKNKPLQIFALKKQLFEPT